MKNELPELPVIVEMFCGAGGASIGIHRALGSDYGCYANDVDGDALMSRAPLQRRYVGIGKGVEGPAREFVDEIGARRELLHRVALLWASPPCQRHSRAGSGDGYDGWPDTVRMVERVLPRNVILENVVGAPTDAWARELRRYGYRVEIWKLDASDFDVPQRRIREFVVATQGRLPNHPPEPHAKKVSLGDALPHLRLERAPRSSFTGEIVYAPRRGSRAATERWRLGEPSPTVMTTEVKGTRACMLRGWTFNGGPDRASDAAFLAVGRRRLTPEECAVLQGFDKGTVFTGAKSSRYRQIGNAVPPPLAEAVVRHLMGC